MTVAPQAETEVVTGIIQGIVQKGTDDYGNPDKWQVEVNTGQQNPRRLWTKDANLIGQLSAMVGQQQSFLCGKSHWTNDQGAPVTSLWVNGVGPADGFQQQSQAPAQPQQQWPAQAQPQQSWPAQQQPSTLPIPQQAPTVVQPAVVTSQDGRVSEAEREKRIHRQTASKVAGILLSHLPQEQRTLDNVLRISESLVGYYEFGMTAAQPAPNPDDDIPF